MSPVTREQAEAVADAVRAQFASYFEPLKLDDGTEYSALAKPEDVIVFERDNGRYGKSWEVSWEDGPYEWAYGFGADPYVDEAVTTDLIVEFGVKAEKARELATNPRIATLPKGVSVEPYYSFSLVVSEA